MRRNAIVRKSDLTNLELGHQVRERDADLKENGPITTRTPFGLWEFGPTGTSNTTYDLSPHRIKSKRKYTRNT